MNRKTDGALKEIKDFDFETEFEIHEVLLPESTYNHGGVSMANYQGFPLILGGGTLSFGGRNNKLEMLNTMENPPRWVEGKEYPYDSM